MASFTDLPAVGHAPAFFSDKLGFLVRSARRSDVFEVRLGRGRTLLLNDPDDIRHVLVTEHSCFTKNTRLVRPGDETLFGDALVGAPKAEHADRRRALQPVYRQEQVASFGPVVEQCVDELAGRWAALGEVDLVAETEALAHRIRACVLLGDDAGAHQALPPLLEARQRYIAQSFLSPVPWAGRLPGRARRGYRRTAPELERLVAAEIDRRRTAPGADLLSRLMAADGTNEADPQAFDEARTFLASYEVSSRALAWSLHALAEQPDVQEQLAADAGPADLVGYPQMVLSEALRLYPPSWLFTRVASSRVELPSGAVVAPGWRLFLSPFATQRDPRRFPDPERFDPERFRPGPELRSRPRFAYFPFGGGPHVCIGEGFVRMEAALTITRLVQRLELGIVPGTRAVPSPRVTLELAGRPRLHVRRRVSA